MMLTFPKHKPVRLRGKRLSELRQKCYERTSGRCSDCGIFAGWDWGEMSHQIPRSLGGADTDISCTEGK